MSDHFLSIHLLFFMHSGVGILLVSKHPDEADGVFFEPFSISLIVWLADVCRLIVPLSSQNAELELVVSVVSVLQDPWLVTKFFAS